MSNVRDGDNDIRRRSGEVDSNDPLVAFLYLLMRDHVLPGDVEGVLKQVTPSNGYRFCNGWLASHAADIARRLRPSDERDEACSSG